MEGATRKEGLKNSKHKCSQYQPPTTNSRPCNLNLPVCRQELIPP
ncbi:Ribonucleoside-diphosphate reductase large subunit [Bienertia sinuspersici]